MKNDFFDFDREFTIMTAEHGLTQVVILGHMNPDGDAAGSVMGLAHYIHMVYPEIQVFPYLSEKLDKGPKMMTKLDRTFDAFRKPENQKGADFNEPQEGKKASADEKTGGLNLSQPYGVIVCDTATRARMIGLEYYENAAYSIVIDHHASDEGYGNVNYTKISESCAANVYEALDHGKLMHAAGEAHPNAADYLYLGIMHDTGGFARANVDIMSAGADLLKMGVDHRWMMRTLNTQTLEDKYKEGLLLSSARHIGQIAYVIVNQEFAENNHITYEDIHPISGVLRDCEDIELGFTMYEEEPDIWRCSFRSDGKWINVNELLIPFGGGGHVAAAGLRIPCTDQPALLGQIMEQIGRMRDQKNNSDE